ncbi:Plastocyanin-like [Macleaya cordata]|uniref:Plastocyanin-like n=1 Tax=Macleaya cordata TaxID=56857 RepID=A0A200PVD4_MACCD|nr:Plastocyanin-like [Macleaya cordata]
MNRAVMRSRSNAVEGIGLLLCLFLGEYCEIVHGRTYVVGGKQGWDLYPELMNWPTGKRFKARDVLVFNYKTEGGNLYSLARVNKTGYELCEVGDHAKRFRTGHDRVKLVMGANYFICSVRDFCGYGMRIALLAK